jgi:hypothetical protein
VHELGENANTVVLRLIAEWLDRGIDLDPTVIAFLKKFWHYLPAAAAIKEIRGRVIFANPEFMRVVNSSNVTGALPTDYFREYPLVAERVMAHDRAALDSGKAFLSVDRIPVGGKMRDRLAIRFPIFDRAHSQVEMTGVVGFDLEQVEKMAQSLQPGASDSFEVPPVDPNAEPSPLPDTMLHSFIQSLPGIVTVKDGPTDRLLWINAEYGRVIGRRRSEVVGKRPSENWAGELGAHIERRDGEVRSSLSAVMSVEGIPTASKGLQERLNIRFPMLEMKDGSPKMSHIGTIGFPYQVFKAGLAMLRNTVPRHQSALLLADDPDSLEALTVEF